MSAAITLDSIVSVAPGQLASRVGSEVVILGLDRGAYYGLNPSGAWLWEKLQTPTRVGVLHTALLEKYEVDPEIARQDLIRLLEGLYAAELIEVRTTPEAS
jgi:hypothetical protein